MAVADGDGRLSTEERGLWGVRCSPVSPVWLLHWWTHKRLQRPGSSLLQMTSSAAQGGAGALLYCEDSISGPLGRTAQRSARAGLGRRAWIRIKETKGIPGLRGPWQTCWAWSSPLVWQAVGPGAALAPGVVLAPTHAILTFGDLFPSVHGAGRSCSELLFSHFKHKVTHFFFCLPRHMTCDLSPPSRNWIWAFSSESPSHWNTQEFPQSHSLISLQVDFNNKYSFNHYHKKKSSQLVNAYCVSGAFPGIFLFTWWFLTLRSMQWGRVFGFPWVTDGETEAQSCQAPCSESHW